MKRTTQHKLKMLAQFKEKCKKTIQKCFFVVAHFSFRYTYKVRFVEYGNEQECTEDYLRPLRDQSCKQCTSFIRPGGSKECKRCGFGEVSGRRLTMMLSELEDDIEVEDVEAPQKRGRRLTEMLAGIDLEMEELDETLIKSEEKRKEGRTLTQMFDSMDSEMKHIQSATSDSQIESQEESGSVYEDSQQEDSLKEMSVVEDDDVVVEDSKSTVVVESDDSTIVVEEKAVENDSSIIVAEEEKVVNDVDEKVVVEEEKSVVELEPVVVVAAVAPVKVEAVKVEAKPLPSVEDKLLKAKKIQEKLAEQRRKEEQKRKEEEEEKQMQKQSEEFARQERLRKRELEVQARKDKQSSLPTPPEAPLSSSPVVSENKPKSRAAEILERAKALTAKQKSHQEEENSLAYSASGSIPQVFATPAPVVVAAATPVAATPIATESLSKAVKSLPAPPSVPEMSRSSKV
jgi:hypothetical protein